MIDMKGASTNSLWVKFRDTLTSLVQKYVPSKSLREGHRRKPWVDQKVKTAIRKKAKLYTRMKKTQNPSDIRKYRSLKSATQKLERQAYHRYVNKTEDDCSTRPRIRPTF